MKILTFAVLLFIPFTVVFGQQNFSITGNAVGGVKLGMTVAQARRALKGCRLKRTSDGEGIALIGVICKKKEIISLFADEEAVDQPINERARIKHIEIWDSRFKTVNGVHKGMSVSAAERRIGKVKEIILTPIESREFVTFSRQPRGISYRVYGRRLSTGLGTDKDIQSRDKDLEHSDLEVLALVASGQAGHMMHHDVNA